ncbi:hypothetical protein RclHR1_01310005 [Rhizophagus clarus]|uniref:F-box domain-containing protein n=1 Tax=Rhizophagus clarus TaxID=94130 RepID=A0A2Z6QLN5_9GLOM|nr:hypothetical protein RclHR1_01310005 [Rhizophagus clarus]GES91757.1 hypothetical protein GLOIN_2v1784777 [Rhizophagus clarus]
MTLPTLPVECLSNVLSFLDDRSLYKCLFVNRYYCTITVPMIWTDPFIRQISASISRSLIKALLACLDEDEISSLIPNFDIEPSLFEYARFIRRINHDCCVEHIKTFSELVSRNDNIDCRVQKLIDAIYHMIIRKSPILQEFEINVTKKGYFDLPKFSINEPGFRNLRSLTVFNLDLIYDDAKHQNTTIFLNMVSTFCEGLVNLELWVKSLNSVLAKQYLDIIKFQPLKRILMYINNSEKIPFNLGLEFRSETLKELILDSIDFQYINLSFISKLECLKLLEFLYCKGFDHLEVSSQKRFHLKEFKLWYCNTGVLMEEIIKYLCGESLLKLTLSNVTPKAAKAVKDFCPNINFLCIRYYSRVYSDLIIPYICELSSLKVLNIGSDFGSGMSSLVRNLGDNLLFVEDLFFDFNVDLESFVYFIDNCRANLKKWIIILDDYSLSKDYLLYISQFQEVHNSLKAFGIKRYEYNWTNEEKEIVDILNIQGVDIVTSDELDFLFY